jgi:predicted transcriptional regulator
MILMKYRSRTDISVLILEAANGGATKTKIMYKAFLTYLQLKEYLTMLSENGLLEFEEATQNYRTTEKGLRLLQIYNRVDRLVPNVRAV